MIMYFFSECPGEYYNEFLEEESVVITKETPVSQFRIDYYKNGDLERRWKYCKTIEDAITKAYKMIHSGNYTIIGIENA